MPARLPSHPDGRRILTDLPYAENSMECNKRPTKLFAKSKTGRTATDARMSMPSLVCECDSSETSMPSERYANLAAFSLNGDLGSVCRPRAGLVPGSRSQVNLTVNAQTVHLAQVR